MNEEITNELIHSETIESDRRTFVLKDLLGEGSAGSVYLAEEQGGEETVAVKYLHTEGAADEHIDARFVREISVLEKLNHPNIVKYCGCGVSERGLYYVMEKVPYGTLKDVLKRRERLGWKAAVECALHICNGLKHAHQLGIIHRDLKPANVFLSEDGNLKLGDFGLALDTEARSISLDGTTVGTMEYMAPEQIRGEKVDGRADLYAVGCMLFEMTASHAPFWSLDAFEMQTMHLEAPIPSIRDIAHGVPLDFEKCIKQFLAKDPAERPQSAEEACEILAKLIDFDLSTLPQGEVVSNEDPTEQPGQKAPLAERLRPKDDLQPEVSMTGILVVAGGVILLLIIIALVNSFG